MRFHTAAAVNLEIARLSDLLGQDDPGDVILNMKAGHERIRDLELQCREAGINIGPAATNPTKPVIASKFTGNLARATGATPTAKRSASTPTRKQLIGLIGIVEPQTVHQIRDDWSDADVRDECERVLFSAHLRAAFMRPDAELSVEYFRPELKGVARTIKAFRQEAISNLFK